MNGWASSWVRRRRTVAGVTAAAAALSGPLFLAGCSKDEAPAAAVVTATPTPTPSPSPTLPATAKQATKSSAVAFTYYWFAAYSHATWALTPDELKAVSDPTCSFCNKAIQNITALKDGERTVEGGRITITDAKATSGTPAKGMRIDGVYDQAASTVKNSSGGAISTNPGIKGARVLVAVKWTGSKWVVLDVVLL